MTKTEQQTESTGFILAADTYDRLKTVVQIILPALGSLYFGLAQIWGLPSAEQVVGSLALVATFGGVLLSVSRKNYLNSDAPYDGNMVITETDGVKTFSMELNAQPEMMEEKKSVTFKVDKTVL